MSKTVAREQASADAVAELEGLIVEVRQCLTSAENALQRCEPERVERETIRMRKMLLGWRGVDDSDDIGARMHFVAAIEFAVACMTTPPIPTNRMTAVERHAQIVADHVRQLTPSAARHVDPAAIAQAIEARINKRGFWPAVAQAWGRGDIPEKRWSSDWSSRQK